MNLLRTDEAKVRLVRPDLALPESVEVLVVSIAARAASTLFNLGDG